MKGMPKRNKRVMTPKGEGKVRDVYPLRKTVLVSLPEIGIKEFQLDEVEVINIKQESPLPKQKNTFENNGSRNTNHKPQRG